MKGEKIAQTFNNGEGYSSSKSADQPTAHSSHNSIHHTAQTLTCNSQVEKP